MPNTKQERFQIGSCVELKGLKRSEYNGDRAMVLRGMTKKSGRIEVLHFHRNSLIGRGIRVKPENLEPADFFVKLINCSSKRRKRKAVVATKRIKKGELVLCEKPMFKSTRKEHLDKVGLGFILQFCDEQFTKCLCAIAAYEELDVDVREEIRKLSAPEAGSSSFDDIVRARINPLVMDQPEFREKFVEEKGEYLELVARMATNAFSFRSESPSCEVLYKMGS